MLEADGGHRKKVSVIGGISVSPTPGGSASTSPRSPTGSTRRTRSWDTSATCSGIWRGNVVVIWNLGQNHRGEAVRQLLRRNRRLHLEMLPPWAPDHNPVEAVWSWLKYGVCPAEW